MHARASHIGCGIAIDGPQKPNQTRFAAVTEIVTILKEDPETNWTTVNVAALRQQSILMEMLAKGADPHQ